MPNHCGTPWSNRESPRAKARTWDSSQSWQLAKYHAGGRTGAPYLAAVKRGHAAGCPRKGRKPPTSGRPCKNTTHPPRWRSSKLSVERDRVLPTLTTPPRVRSTLIMFPNPLAAPTRIIPLHHGVARYPTHIASNPMRHVVCDSCHGRDKKVQGRRSGHVAGCPRKGRNPPTVGRPCKNTTHPPYHNPLWRPMSLRTRRRAAFSRYLP